MAHKEFRKKYLENWRSELLLKQTSYLCSLNHTNLKLHGYNKVLDITRKKRQWVKGLSCYYNGKFDKKTYFLFRASIRLPWITTFPSIWRALCEKWSYLFWQWKFNFGIFLLGLGGRVSHACFWPNFDTKKDSRPCLNYQWW